MVIDQTGITEKFDFQVECAPDGADLSEELTAPSITWKNRPKTDTAACSPKSGQIAWVSFGKQTPVTFPVKDHS
jgi:hypothetical protein